MRARTGCSAAKDPRAAVEEATRSFAQETPKLVLAFASSELDVGGITTELARRFPASVVAGCTTSGERVDGVASQGTLAVMALDARRLRAGARLVRDLETFDAARAAAVAAELFAAIDVAPDDADPSKVLCLMFVDGLSLREEAVAERMTEALGGVPVLGGSAGDDLRFRETRVFAGSELARDAAVFVLVRSETPFAIVKHQHFVTRPTLLAITRAEPERRRVLEIDGFPAAEAYARALGLRPEEVTSDVAFSNPVTFTSDGALYVRSIQRIEPDGSIVFYAAIEEGMVLELAGHREMVDALDADFEKLREKLGRASAFVGFNCILRALESRAAKLDDALGERYRALAERSLCFDTYGEQLDGLHINQTLVGVAFARDEEAA